MSRVFEYDPNKRITAIEMFSHQWFRGEYLPGEGSQIDEQLGTGGYAAATAAPAGKEDNQEGQDNGPKYEIHSDGELQLQVQSMERDIEQPGQGGSPKQQTQSNDEQQVDDYHPGNHHPGKANTKQHLQKGTNY